MQFVRMVNAGTETYDFHHENQKRWLKAGEEAMVPWHVACSLFGDPYTVDTPQDQARTRVWKQAISAHNFMDGHTTTAEWEHFRPKIEVFDVETGARIHMVYEDFDGTKNSGALPASNAQLNNVVLQQQIENLTKQVESLASLQVANSALLPAQGQSAMASQDDPDVAQDHVANGFDLAITTPDVSDVVTEDLPQAVPTGPAPKLAKRGS